MGADGPEADKNSCGKPSRTGRAFRNFRQSSIFTTPSGSGSDGCGAGRGRISRQVPVFRVEAAHCLWMSAGFRRGMRDAMSY